MPLRIHFGIRIAIFLFFLSLVIFWLQPHMIYFFFLLLIANFVFDVVDKKKRFGSIFASVAANIFLLLLFAAMFLVRGYFHSWIILAYLVGIAVSLGYLAFFYFRIFKKGPKSLETTFSQQ